MSTQISSLGSAVIAASEALSTPSGKPAAGTPAPGTPAAKPAPGTPMVKPALTAVQKTALKQLHATAQQFESLFVNMLFKSMRAASPQTSISGEKLSAAETTFTEMLDEKRSESMAQTGAFGIAKVLEDQLRESVLANPEQAAKARLAPDGVL